MFKNTLVLFLSVILSSVIFITFTCDKPTVTKQLQAADYYVNIADFSSNNNFYHLTKTNYVYSINPHNLSYKLQQPLLNIEDVLRLLLFSSIY